MYHFGDYFDVEKKEIPYASPQEELDDYLRLLDMLLENYLEFKGLGKNKKLFSRGLVITESELEGYFEAPPLFRKTDAVDPALAADAEDAFDHIESRACGIESRAGGSYIIDRIGQIFDLDRREIMALILALAPELDRRYERIYGFLQDDVSRKRPTIGLLNALYARIDDEQGASGAIAYNYGYLLSDKMFDYFFLYAGDDINLSTELVPNPYARRILAGGVFQNRLNSPSGSTSNNISGTLSVGQYTEDPGSPVIFEADYKSLEYALHQNNTPSIYVGNSDPDTVLHLTGHFCIKNDEPLYVIDLDRLVTLSKDRIDQTLSECSLRVKLNNGRLCMKTVREKKSVMIGEDGNRSVKAGPDSRRDKSEVRAYVTDRLTRSCAPKSVVIFGNEEEPEDLVEKNVPYLRISEPDINMRINIWEYYLDRAADSSGLSVASDVCIPDLADCFDIGYSVIRKTCEYAAAEAGMREDKIIGREIILSSLRRLSQVDFMGLATYIKPSYTWDDITVTESQKELLKTVCDRYRLRNRVGDGWGLKKKNAYGNGVSVLLYGPPGTGKTMAAQIVAGELGLPLYRVDISQIFSKYIGETEKNLAVIFGAARKANVILFFDEADALFAKRTEVNDSNDKYSNSETAFLLQKVEEYDGMSILATNYYNNFDSAFLRRITYSVYMESPDEEARYRLWTTILPPEASLSDDIDFKLFAREFDLSGSNIKAILFSAAYMAAAEGRSIGASHIVRAMQYEYRKLGQYIDSGKFGPYASYLQG